MIKRIKVHTEDSLEEPNYRFNGNFGVEKFLEIFSGIGQKVFKKSKFSNNYILEEDYDAFCLAYMFTYRDFEVAPWGLLGLEISKMLAEFVKRMG